MEVSEIHVAERIGVSYERRFPVVVEIVPGDCDPVAGAHNVALAVVFIWAMVDVGFEFIVVDPDASAVLDCDSVVAEDKSNTQVSNDNISLTFYGDATAGYVGSFSCAEKGFVAANLEARCQIEVSFHIDDAWFGAGYGLFQCGGVGDGEDLSACPTCCFAEGIVFAESDEAEIRFVGVGGGEHC